MSAKIYLAFVELNRRDGAQQSPQSRNIDKQQMDISNPIYLLVQVVDGREEGERQLTKHPSSSISHRSYDYARYSWYSTYVMSLYWTRYFHKRPVRGLVISAKDGSVPHREKSLERKESTANLRTQVV